MHGTRILLTIVLTTYGFVAVGSGLDRVSVHLLAVERVVPWPFRAQANRSAAALDLARQQPERAIGHAIAAVEHDPVDIQSAAYLGAARFAARDENGAAAAFRVAARFGWRDLNTQLYWYSAALQAADYVTASERLDAILATHPTSVDRDALFSALESSAAGQAALMKRLREQPSWLWRYLDINKNAPPELLDRRVSILSELGKEGYALGCANVARLTEELINGARRMDAEKIWNIHCRQTPVRGLVADEGFVWIDQPERFPFTWRVKRSGDVAVTNEHTSEGRHEVVARSSAPAPREILEQPVALQPGTYRLSLSPTGGGAVARRVLVSFGCDGPAPFPQEQAPGAMQEGQLIYVGQCRQQLLGLWITPGQTPVRLTGAHLEKVN